jgi:hypothetical protein
MAAMCKGVTFFLLCELVLFLGSNEGMGVLGAMVNISLVFDEPHDREFAAFEACLMQWSFPKLILAVHICVAFQ